MDDRIIVAICIALFIIVKFCINIYMRFISPALIEDGDILFDKATRSFKIGLSQNLFRNMSWKNMRNHNFGNECVHIDFPVSSNIFMYKWHLFKLKHLTKGQSKNKELVDHIIEYLAPKLDIPEYISVPRIIAGLELVMIESQLYHKYNMDVDVGYRIVICGRCVDEHYGMDYL